jgi:hypothetical protein
MTEPLVPTPTGFQSAIDLCNDALTAWEDIKTELNLGDDIIAEGNRLLREAGII